MVCQVCEFNEYGQKDTVTVAVKDYNGRLHYVCKDHAQEILNEHIKCYNCGSIKNENYNEYWESYRECEYSIRCSKCKTDIGYYAFGGYDIYKSKEDYEENCF